MRKRVRKEAFLNRTTTRIEEGTPSEYSLREIEGMDRLHHKHLWQSNGGKTRNGHPALRRSADGTTTKAECKSNGGRTTRGIYEKKKKAQISAERKRVRIAVQLVARVVKTSK